MENLEELGLKLRIERKYSIEDSGLSKLVFGRNRVTLTQNSSPLIINLELKLDYYPIDYRISSREFQRFIYPFYMLFGIFDNGCIYGVIRNQLVENKKSRFLIAITPIEFHFYLENFGESKKGKSIVFKDGRLICGLKDSAKIDAIQIDYNFNVDLINSRNNIESVYFER